MKNYIVILMAVLLCGGIAFAEEKHGVFKVGEKIEFSVYGLVGCEPGGPGPAPEEKMSEKPYAIYNAEVITVTSQGIAQIEAYDNQKRIVLSLYLYNDNGQLRQIDTYEYLDNGKIFPHHSTKGGDKVENIVRDKPEFARPFLVDTANIPFDRNIKFKKPAKKERQTIEEPNGGGVPRAILTEVEKEKGVVTQTITYYWGGRVTETTTAVWDRGSKRINELLYYDRGKLTAKAQIRYITEEEHRKHNKDKDDDEDDDKDKKDDKDKDKDKKHDKDGKSAPPDKKDK